MFRVVCLFLALCVAVGLELKADIGNQWKKFKTVHGKEYSGAEEIKRKLVFQRNIEAILQHNLRSDLGEETYTQGINEFSDIPHEEFVKTMCGFNGSRVFEVTSVENSTLKALTAPASIDWRWFNAVTGVKNQGNCGSCTAFAGVGVIEGAWALKNRRLQTMSEQQILDCARDQKYDNFGCNGGWTNGALQYVIDTGGLVREDCYRYQTKQGSCSYDSGCLNRLNFDKYVTSRPDDENALKENIAIRGPMSIAIDAGRPSFQSYKSGIYNPPDCTQSRNHAVLLIGYGTENGKDYWTVKNSWGSGWGEQGFFKLARNAGNKCAVAGDAVYLLLK